MSAAPCAYPAPTTPAGPDGPVLCLPSRPMPILTDLPFQNAAGRLLDDPQGFLRVYWGSRPRQPGQAQELFTRMADALRRRGWSRILVQQTDMQPFTPDEQQWIAQTWLPYAVQEAGYRYGAVVVSRHVLTRLATAYVTTNVRGLPLTYRSFESEAEAEAWLCAQPG